MAFLNADNKDDSFYTPPWAYESLPIDWTRYKDGLVPPSEI